MEEKSKTPQMSEISSESDADDESDCEVLMKGSELEKLSSTLWDDVEVFTPAAKQEYPKNLLPSKDLNISNTFKNDDPEFIALKELLLNSGLMLDEDLAFLVSDYPGQQVSQPFFKRWNRVLLLSCCTTLALSCFHLMTYFKWPVLIITLSSFGSSIYLSLKINQVLKLKSGLKKMIQEMTDVCQFIKKTTATIKETKTSVDSKIVLLHLRKKNADITDRYYAQVKADIEATSDSFLKFIINLTLLTRNATRQILGSSHFAQTPKFFYIALCSVEELGLPSFNDNIHQGNISTSKLDELCDQYILMQSEYLRVLGMWLCSSEYVNPEDISLNVSLHFKHINELHEPAKQLLAGGLFAKHLENRIPCAESRDMILTQMNSALTSLLSEAYCLQSYIHDKVNLTFEDDSLFLELSLGNLESCFSECTDLIKRIRSILHTHNNNLGLPSDTPLTLASGSLNSSVTKTGVEVGQSDFSVMVEDKVYLCISDSEELTHHDNGGEINEDTPTYPKSLMSELKGVLEGKRLEFKQRESDAIRNSELEDIEKHFDLIQLNKPLEQSCSSIGRVPRDSSVSHPEEGFSNKAEETQENSGEILSSFSFSKSIAASAARTSSLWNCQVEEFFGEEDSTTD